MIAVIIVSYNTKEPLVNCLNSLKRSVKQNIGLEIWVVDNASKDGSAEMVRENYPRVNLIANDKNLGFAKANNQAISKIQSKYIFLLNPDAEVLNGALNKMVSYMDADERLGVLGPKLVDANGSVQKEIAPFPKLLDTILILLKLHRIKPLSYLVYPNYDYDKTQEVEHLMGSALLIRKKVFDDIGFFDENFFLWFEETDFEKRAKGAGWEIVYYPQASVKHLIGQSSRQLNPFKKQTIWNKSLWIYFKKHRSMFDRVILVPFLFLSYLTSGLVYLKNRIRVE